ncbi:hypothetical protein [Brevibacillus sp. MCWH]|uniref:DUF7484 family protein n=1 Tax=Brevibacillus sp. MCWH TaxID=2508871 RepID=UPI0014921A80|nr:hypothetical protein [Brevibacillus sp. MCWH]NNV04676.1 hypothetical protein [Brevibacillus sp. MCWH]
MMSIGELLTSIKMDLGIYGLALPFEDENKILYDTIKLRTLKTFSQFFPHIISVDFKINELKCIKSQYQESIYELPDVFGDRKIIYVRKVSPKNKLSGYGYTTPVFDDSMDIYNSLMMAQASANLLSTITPPFTFKFVQPNLLYLYNMTTYGGEITVDFGLEHTDNLMTIPNSAWEGFYELALIDVKRFLYNSLKHYNELQTAYGTINLKIDDWSNAESDRKELIEKWRNYAHIDGENFYII